MTDEKDLEEQIRDFYLKHDYSKEAIAEKLNISVGDIEPYIKKLELEVWQITPDNLEKYKELSCEAQQLFNAMLKQASFVSNPSSRPLSRRDEANAIAYHAFRSGYLEEIHAGPDSRISNEEIKKLMLESSARIQEWLEIRDMLLPEKKVVYNTLLRVFREIWTKDWEREKREYEIES
jgi:predicted DNA-binding protein YlxM (UPF0122 family)